MFDPQLPQEGTPLDAVQMRGQFNGLKALIDALQTVTAAQVDAVTTVEPWQPAGAAVSVVGNTLHFTFDLPRGNNGADGSTGSDGQPGRDGMDGGPGPPGPQGPPFAQASVSGVTTLEPGQSATVDVSFDGTTVHFTFGIPRGSDGSSGSDGAPGEVTAGQLADAINGTSANTNAVSTLDTNFADGDMEALRQKLNELILNGRR